VYHNCHIKLKKEKKKHISFEIPSNQTRSILADNSY
jgi:hypothetical protein